MAKSRLLELEITRVSPVFTDEQNKRMNNQIAELERSIDEAERMLQG